MNNHSFWCLSLDLLQNNATFGAILLNLSDVILRTYYMATRLLYMIEIECTQRDLTGVVF